ncbi:S1 family peptidase [Amaricoccus tamworthensis]|uniref:S1 family peptidase n=1 Tax=Amaricoccus tamworthensis TaxID=57002 RepID=UPI003C7D026E
MGVLRGMRRRIGVRRSWGLFFLSFAAGLTCLAFLDSNADARQQASPLTHHATVINGKLIGSAFALADGLAVTNAHVVDGLGVGDRVRLVESSSGGSVAQARLHAISGRMDLAVLAIPRGFLKPVPGNGTSGRRGTPVLAAGTDAEKGLSPVSLLELDGRVLVPRKNIETFGPGLVVSLPGVRPGFSGGPLLGLDGGLVGMITAIRPGANQKSRVVSVASKASGEVHVQRGRSDEAYVLRGPEIRAEVERLTR